MKKVFVFVILSALVSIQCGKNKSNTHEACLLRGQAYVYLYDKPYGTIRDSVINDTIDENYVIISINERMGRRSFVPVTVSECLGNAVKEGWIDRSMLGINPSSTSTIRLYEMPSYSSNVVDSITKPAWGDLYHISDNQDGWLYIEEDSFKGWMPPEDQCSNPYSPCC